MMSSAPEGTALQTRLGRLRTPSSAKLVGADKRRRAAMLEGFDDLFRQEYESVARAAAVITGDQSAAAEVAQDAFAQAVVHWAKVSTYERPGAWVRRVAIRRAITVRQRDDVRRRLAPDRSDDHRDQFSVGVGRRIGSVLKVLSPKQRAMVVLHYLDGLAVNEAAEVLGCRPTTASVHLHRARKRLTEEYGTEAVLAEALADG